MSDDKKLIDEILEEIKNSKDDFYNEDTDGLSEEEQKSLFARFDLNQEKKPLAKRRGSFVADIKYTVGKYDSQTVPSNLFDRWKEPDIDENTTTYFKRSRFQPKPLKIDETSDIIMRATAVSEKNSTEFKSEASIIDVHPKSGTDENKSEHRVRSFKGKSVVDPNINNEKNRLFFSATIDGRRRVSKLGSTSDVFTTSTITPASQLSNTSTDDIARLVRSAETAGKSEYSQVVEGQIKLSGFDLEEEPEKVSDEFVEEQLKDSRLKRISEFNARRFFEVEDDDAPEEESSGDISGGFDSNGKITAEEYTENIPGKPVKNSDILYMLRQKYNIAGKRTLCLVVITAINTLLYFLFPPDGSVVLYTVMNLFILLLTGGICMDMLAGGIKSILQKKLTLDFTVAISFIAVLIQNIVFFTLGAEYTVSDINPFQLGVILILLFRSWGRLSVAERIKNNFVSLSSFKDIYAISSIKDSDITEQFSKGLSVENPNIVYSAKAKHISNFLNASYRENGYERKYGIISTVLVCISLITAVVVLAAGSGILNASTMFAALCCFGVPCTTVLCSNLTLLIFSNKLKNNGVVLNYDAADQCANSNMLAIDVCSLFPKSSCSLYGIKTYNNMPVDKAILIITATLAAAENPLAGMFKDIIEGKTAILPRVEQCNYEDKLGISAWVEGSRILIGNREMMTHRGIDVLTQQVERQYLKGDRKILYLAIENVLSAMVVVGFNANEQIARYIKRIQDSDITLLVRSTDPNISEEMLSHCFGVYESTFKILGCRQAEIYRKYSKATHTKVATSVAHAESPMAMLRTFSLALRLKSVFRLSFRINAIGTVLCFLVFASGAFIETSVMVTVPYLLISTLLIAALSCFVPRFLKNRN